MNRKKRALVVGIVMVGAIFAATFYLRGMIHEQRPTTEKVLAYIEANPLENLPDPKQSQFVETLAYRVQRLKYADRKDLLMSTQYQRVVAGFNDRQRQRYLELTVDAGVREFMDALNDMDEVERKEIINQALEELRRVARNRTGEAVIPHLSREDEDRLFQKGFATYYRDASAETKVALQPLVDEVQHIIRYRKH